MALSKQALMLIVRDTDNEGQCSTEDFSRLFTKYIPANHANNAEYNLDISLGIWTRFYVAIHLNNIIFPGIISGYTFTFQG